MGTAEHYNANSIEWDFTGRFIAVITSFWRNPHAECGYMLFTVNGRLVHRVLRDRFLQFLWRPRPASLLTKEHLEVSSLPCARQLVAENPNTSWVICRSL